jgi:hypothetical protein
MVVNYAARVTKYALRVVNYAPRDIYNTGITHDDWNMRIIIVYSTSHWST